MVVHSRPHWRHAVVFDTKLQEYYVWLFARYIGSSGVQSVPGFGGFISATGTPPARKSTIDYFTPIHQPITNNSVVRELLKRSEEASIEVGQKWVISTFDHTSMNYIGTLIIRRCAAPGTLRS